MLDDPVLELDVHGELLEDVFPLEYVSVPGEVLRVWLPVSELDRDEPPVVARVEEVNVTESEGVEVTVLAELDV